MICQECGLELKGNNIHSSPWDCISALKTRLSVAMKKLDEFAAADFDRRNKRRLARRKSKK